MKKHVSLLFLINFLSGSLVAQYQLSGQVMNEQNKPIVFATIAVYPITDSMAIQGIISEIDGSFLLKNLEPDSYKIVVQMLGYQDWEQDLQLTQDIPLGTIVLKEETATLESVEVVAVQSALESRLGKKVLRIGQDLSTTGSNALEALDIIPSVSTTEREQIQIRGSSNIIIYINGKETRRDPSTLKYIAAESLEKIEVITSPSAQYDAEGVAGIINLVYKKGKKGKWKLETITNLTALTDPSSLNPSGGLNASFDKNKFSFFTNISLDHDQYQDLSETTRASFDSPIKLYKGSTTLEGTGLTGNYNLDISLEPDSTLSMGLEVNYHRWDFLNEGVQKNSFDYQDQPSEVFEFVNDRRELENELWINYSMEKTFKPKQTLKLALTTGGEDEANYSNNEEVNIADFPDASQLFLLSSDEIEKQRYYQGKVDFSSPFFTLGKIETGIKADFINYDILQKAVLRSKTIDLPDNEFSMAMQKVGFYILQSHQLNKLEYAIGARIEQFSSSAIQQANQETFTQNYFRFFPSFQLNYLLPNHSHTIGFNFTRRIQRPSFFDLNTFVSYEDPLNLETGNPALQPEIANLYEISYHKEMERLNIDATLYRRKTMDAIQDIITALNENQTITTTTNFGEQIHQGLEGQLEWRINKAFKTTGTFVWNQVQFNSNNYEINFNQQTSWSARLKQQVQLSNSWKLEISENYRAPRFQAQRKVHGQFYMNVGVNKKFNNKRGSISFSIQDIFNSRTYIYSLLTSDFEVQKKYKWQTRQITLGLRYTITE